MNISIKSTLKSLCIEVFSLLFLIILGFAGAAYVEQQTLGGVVLTVGLTLLAAWLFYKHTTISRYNELAHTLTLCSGSFLGGCSACYWNILVPDSAYIIQISFIAFICFTSFFITLGRIFNGNFKKEVPIKAIE